MSGYTGYKPSLRNHVFSYTTVDCSHRAAVVHDAIRHGQYKQAIPLTVDKRPTGRQFLYAQTCRREGMGPDEDPRAIKYICSKKEAPPETRHASGNLIIDEMETCIGTTDKAVTKTYHSTSYPENNCPYKDRTLCLQRQLEPIHNDGFEVLEGRHHIHGYTGHIHALQHLYARSYGKMTRALHKKPANSKTSAEFVYFADNRPLISNSFEERIFV